MTRLEDSYTYFTLAIDHAQIAHRRLEVSALGAAGSPKTLRRRVAKEEAEAQKAWRQVVGQTIDCQTGAWEALLLDCRDLFQQRYCTRFRGLFHILTKAANRVNLVRNITKESVIYPTAIRTPSHVRFRKRPFADSCAASMLQREKRNAELAGSADCIPTKCSRAVAAAQN